mgnify:CR=1 FL=1
MTKIKVFPHEELCPEGAEIEAEPGKTLAEALLDNKIKIFLNNFVILISLYIGIC